MNQIIKPESVDFNSLVSKNTNSISINYQSKMIDLLIHSDEILADKRFSKKLTDSLIWINRTKSKEDTIESVFNLMLSIEGLSNLTGFGITNKFGDSLSGNPERKSYLKVNNLIRKES